MKVFIADDSRMFLERLSDLLKENPAVRLVGSAGNVPDAIHCIQEANPDALILDLHMPGGSGLDVLRAIRRKHPSLCVLICTNYPLPEYRRQCLTAGADFFLDKSVEFEKIPLILSELIRSDMKAARAGK